MDMALGLNLKTITRADLRVRPKDASIIEEEIESELDRRQSARAEKDFATSDAIREALAAKGVEVMDGDPLRRSEEHTSELQSLMRISYAVFCLKKKMYDITTQEHTHTTY